MREVPIFRPLGFGFKRVVIMHRLVLLVFEADEAFPRVPARIAALRHVVDWVALRGLVRGVHGSGHDVHRTAPAPRTRDLLDLVADEPDGLSCVFR